MATIAITDTCIRATDPHTNSALDVLLDQVSSRAPEGAYVLIEQASHADLYESHPNTLGTLLRVVRDLKIAGTQRVVVPCAGVVGLLAAVAGADTWSAGWYRGQRRLRIADLEDDEGRAIPTYFSRQLAGEIHLKTNLDTIVSKNLLNAVADTTPASDVLLKALARGATVSAVPEWRAQTGNTAAAREHFSASLSATNKLLAPMTTQQRLDFARSWLDGAFAAASKISAVLEDSEAHPRTSLTHQRAWRLALDAL